MLLVYYMHYEKMDIAFTYACNADALAALPSAALIRSYILFSGKGVERLVPCVQTNTCSTRNK